MQRRTNRVQPKIIRLVGCDFHSLASPSLQSDAWPYQQPRKIGPWTRHNHSTEKPHATGLYERAVSIHRCHLEAGGIQPELPHVGRSRRRAHGPPRETGRLLWRYVPQMAGILQTELTSTQTVCTLPPEVCQSCKRMEFENLTKRLT